MYNKIYNIYNKYDSLISVDGWLYGLDFDGFADITFKPAFLSG